MTQPKTHVPPAFAWLSPWQPLSDDAAQPLTARLQKALPADHELASTELRALGASEESGDVLFAEAGSERCFVVHLAPEKGKKLDPSHILSFESLADFVEGCMQPDHLEHTEEQDDL